MCKTLKPVIVPTRIKLLFQTPGKNTVKKSLKKKIVNITHTHTHIYTHTLMRESERDKQTEKDKDLDCFWPMLVW